MRRKSIPFLSDDEIDEMDDLWRESQPSSYDPEAYPPLQWEEGYRAAFDILGKRIVELEDRQ